MQTSEQRAAFLHSQTACALIELEGMRAENMQREFKGEAMAYVEADFQAIIEKYPIGHNAALAVLWGEG